MRAGGGPTSSDRTEIWPLRSNCSRKDRREKRFHVKDIAEGAGLAKSGLRREVVMLENMTSLRPPYFSPSAGKLIMVATSVRM
jgi:hypothetical protein